MEFTIDPFVCAGPVMLGMRRQEVRKLSLGPMRSFKRTPSELFPSDQFVELGLVVSYKSADVVETIELSRPAIPLFNGLNLFETPFEKVKVMFSQLDPHLAIDCDGLISKAIGVGLYVLGADEPDDPEDSPEVLSVIVFERGYYDHQ